MKSAIVILAAGLVLCAAAFCGFYYAGTAPHRGLRHEQTPELAWLKNEFKLSDAEWSRITKLHEAYQPHCEAMCQRIEEQNAKLRKLLVSGSAMTTEIEAAVAEAAKLRGECQRDMLRHFLEVSQTMPPEQGRRYLAWISERTLFLADGMKAHGHP
jgi:Spy/CpxP family protein refolding chaperone